MAQLPNPNAMDVVSEINDNYNENDNDNEGGYETDDTATTIDAENHGEYGEALLAAYYDEAPITPPRANRNANANDDTHGTPPTRLLTNNTQMSRQVYKMVIQPDGIFMLVPFTSDDYISGEQPFDINGHAINREELPYVQPRKLFGEEKEGGTSKSKSRRKRRSKRRRAKKSLRKRRSSRNKRRKTRYLSKK